MSDNIRTALYDAEYDVGWRPRASDGARRAVAGWSASTARVVTSWCATASCPPTSPSGDLLAVAATGAYCYSMASNYNRLPRPAVVAVRTGRARVILRRETDDDQFRLEVVNGRESSQSDTRVASVGCASARAA